mmetsp:Transcript_10224/g.14671  ORF Transcript_10224/g.14671 Transcript_10224/m.14671 type:complete len:159 (-) Transcript_10224:122-598(-)|eukprot:CAMPEP_0202444398 /NCGR_PEP_ID=MMETSP1360-20130828/3494_1 /ASSEMBLY_ACC=CAM_ASM_000848 /TAXON_ID=515479 /ORGANISM="Licmophora paradoxa, Strain CCMP2313" /LENGTH=158 /DNA_ID=CAMNT_0049060389 /DNA_START=585 /DNA_END=1061 /DNA_ORIENTATION=-
MPALTFPPFYPPGVASILSGPTTSNTTAQEDPICNMFGQYLYEAMMKAAANTAAVMISSLLPSPTREQESYKSPSSPTGFSLPPGSNSFPNAPSAGSVGGMYHQFPAAADGGFTDQQKAAIIGDDAAIFSTTSSLLFSEFLWDKLVFQTARQKICCPR